MAIAFDPCYISKTGKQTPQVGWYWSGVANSTKWGVKIGGLAVVDIEFLYRDSKQNTFLNHCQARSEKLNTHFNLALTAVNIAKKHIGCP